MKPGHIALAVTVAALWGLALHQYSTAMVAPFALLAPVVGALSSAWICGEELGPLRLAGMATMLLGLAIVVLPLERIAALTRRRQ